MSSLGTLTVIIPLFNEVNTIGQLLDRLLEIKLENLLEIIVVDDASTDSSQLTIKENDKLKILTHDKNLGKTECIKTALKVAIGDYVLIQDADLEYPPSNIPILLDVMKKNQCDAVYGKRAQKDVVLYQTKLGLFATSFLFKWFFGKKIEDINTGHKLFKTEDLKRIDFNYKRFTFCVESTYFLLRHSKKILEVPIEYISRNKQEGKKINFFDGVEIIVIIFLMKLKEVFKCD